MAKLTTENIIDVIKSPETLAHFSLAQWNDLVFILRKEKLLARVYLLLSEQSLLHIIPEPALRHFSNAVKMSTKQAIIAKSEAEKLSSSLSDKARYIVFLKGVAYSLSNSPAALGRIYADIDIVVPKESLKSIEEFLTVFGWYSEELDDYDEHYYRQWAHEIPPMCHSSRGTVLDIHHNLVPPVSGKHIDIESFIENYREEVGGVTVLSEPAKFFHSAIHLFFNDDMTSAFRDMTDLYLITKSQSSSFYVDLLNIIDDYGFEKECMLALYFLQTGYDVVFPQSVITRLVEFKKKSNRWELRLLARLIAPKHKLLVQGESRLVQFLGEMRGHWLKMPMHILFYHTGMKFWRFIVKSLFGKHIFLKEDPH